MENIPVKKQKPKLSTSAIRVKNETRKRILAELAKINKKDFGKKAKVENLIALAVSLIKPEHLKELQESTLTYADRMERDYKAYTAKYGAISKDEFLGKVYKAYKAESDTQENLGPNSEKSV